MAGLASMAKPPLRAGTSPDDEAPESSPDMDASSPTSQAARTMMDAIKDDDAESFADALGAINAMREADAMGAGGPPTSEGGAPPKPALKVTIGRAAK